MSNFELEIEELKRKIEELENKKNRIPTYQYSKIRDVDLREIFTIKRNLDDTPLNYWIKNNIKLDDITNEFLIKLLENNKKLLSSYKEEDLKIKFISKILNQVDFLSYENEFREFYEEPLTYKTDDFILNGTSDFVISKGLTYSEKPYFFIQEFKRSKANSDPEPQLLAELISAIELNNWTTIKGAYIVGENWNFVILNRFKKHHYEYFLSETFNSSKIEDLKGIFRILLFIKEEITEMIKRGY